MSSETDIFWVEAHVCKLRMVRMAAVRSRVLRVLRDLMEGVHPLVEGNKYFSVYCSKRKHVILVDDGNVCGHVGDGWIAKGVECHLSNVVTRSYCVTISSSSYYLLCSTERWNESFAVWETIIITSTSLLLYDDIISR